MTKTLPQYEHLPHLQTIDDVADFVLDMLNSKSGIYTPGIRQALDDMSFSQGQLGILAETAAEKLRVKLEPYSVGEDDGKLADHLEKAFWTPLHASVKPIINPVKINKIDPKTARLYAATTLYVALDTAIGNMRLFMGSNGLEDGISRASKGKKSGVSRVFEVYSAMPAYQTLDVLKNGVLPQLAVAIKTEAGFNNHAFDRAVKAVKSHWAENGAALSNVEMLKSVNAVEWMRFGRLPAHLIREELEQIAKDAPLALPAPRPSPSAPSDPEA